MVVLLLAVQALVIDTSGAVVAGAAAVRCLAGRTGVVVF